MATTTVSTVSAPRVKRLRHGEAHDQGEVAVPADHADPLDRRAAPGCVPAAQRGAAGRRTGAAGAGRRPTAKRAAAAANSAVTPLTSQQHGRQQRSRPAWRRSPAAPARRWRWRARTRCGTGTGAAPSGPGGRGSRRSSTAPPGRRRSASGRPRPPPPRPRRWRQRAAADTTISTRSLRPRSASGDSKRRQDRGRHHPQQAHHPDRGGTTVAIGHDPEADGEGPLGRPGSRGS